MLGDIFRFVAMVTMLCIAFYGLYVLHEDDNEGYGRQYSPAVMHIDGDCPEEVQIPTRYEECREMERVYALEEKFCDDYYSDLNNKDDS